MGLRSYTCALGPAVTELLLLHAELHNALTHTRKLAAPHVKQRHQHYQGRELRLQSSFPLALLPLRLSAARCCSRQVAWAQPPLAGAPLPWGLAILTPGSITPSHALQRLVPKRDLITRQSDR